MTGDCYLVFTDGSTYLYPDFYVQAQAMIKADIIGTAFDAFFRRGAVTGDYTNTGGYIDPAAVQFYANPPYHSPFVDVCAPPPPFDWSPLFWVGRSLGGPETTWLFMPPYATEANAGSLECLTNSGDGIFWADQYGFLFYDGPSFTGKLNCTWNDDAGNSNCTYSYFDITQNGIPLVTQDVTALPGGTVTVPFTVNDTGGGTDVLQVDVVTRAESTWLGLPAMAVIVTSP